MTEEPVFEHLYATYLDFARMPISQQAPTACLGCLFRTYPILVLRDQTMAWMDAVFKSNDLDNHARLLGVIHEFMQNEAKKKAESRLENQQQLPALLIRSAGGESKNMSDLIGSAPELSESG